MTCQLKHQEGFRAKKLLGKVNKMFTWFGGKSSEHDGETHEACEVDVPVSAKHCCVST